MELFRDTDHCTSTDIYIYTEINQAIRCVCKFLHINIKLNVEYCIPNEIEEIIKYDVMLNM